MSKESLEPHMKTPADKNLRKGFKESLNCGGSDEGYIFDDVDGALPNKARRDKILSLLKTLLIPRRGIDPKQELPELQSLYGVASDPEKVLQSSFTEAQLDALEQVLKSVFERLEDAAKTLNALRTELRNKETEILNDGLPMPFDLRLCRDTERKKTLVQQVASLMWDNYFSNVSAEERHRRGCIYHIPLSDPQTPSKGIDFQVLENRIQSSEFFLVMVDDRDRLMGFVEITSGKPGLYPESGCGVSIIPQSYLNAPVWETFIKYKPSDILHEQLIVTRAGLTTADGKPMKGVGTKLLRVMFTQMQILGAHVCTTEVQNTPPNNNSLGLHSRHYPFHLLTTHESLPVHGIDHQSVSFTVFLKPLTEKAERDFSNAVKKK